MPNTSNSESIAIGLAAEIRELAKKLTATRERLIEYVISIGEKLQEIKNISPHGEYDKWCKVHLGIKKTRRADYMRLAEAFRNGNIDRVLGKTKIGDYDGGIKGLLKLLHASSETAKEKKTATVFDTARTLISRERNAHKQLKSTVLTICEMGKKANNPELAEELIAYVEDRKWLLESMEKLTKHAEKARRATKSLKISFGSSVATKALGITQQ